jgi:asparagine synthase (glutamine-hydrolysing)
VALTGDGGDETFWGYWKYREYERLRWLYRMPSLARIPFRVLLHLSRKRPASRGDAAWYAYRLGKLMELCSGRSFYDAYYASQRAYGADTVVKRTSRAALDSRATIPEDLVSDLGSLMVYADTVGYLVDDLHAKVDRASMQVGLETREPLLDYRLLEFAASLPREMKAKGTQGKRVLRELLYENIPRHIIDRPKQGFAIPMEIWLRKGLRSWAEETLLTESKMLSDLFELAAVKRIWQEHQSGVANHKDILWNLLVLVGWLRSNKWN